MLTPFARTPSRRVSPLRYPEEWAWWWASAWHLVVEDTSTGGLLLYTYRRRKTNLSQWAFTLTPAEALDPPTVRRLLAEALYCHLHPQKSQAASRLTGRVCSNEQLSAFIEGQRQAQATREYSLAT